MLLLKTISLTNFLSHKKTSIDFGIDQKLLISGMSGSGKSSVVDSIIWVLFGVGRSDNKSLIKKGAKGAKVSLVLIDSEDEKISFRIERGITSSNKHTLGVFELNDKNIFIPIKVTGIKPIQEHIEKKILKSSYLLFVNSIAYLQESNDSFATQTASRRKEILMEMIKADDYSEYFKKAKEALSEIKNRLEILDNKVSDRKSQIARDTEKTKDIERYKKEKVIIDRDIKTIEDEIDSLLESQKELGEQIAILSTKEQSKDDLVATIIQNTDTLSGINNKIISLQSTDIKLLENDVTEYKLNKQRLTEEEEKRCTFLTWQENLNAINASRPPVRAFDSELEEINKQMIAIFSEDVPTCPKCGTKYPQFEENKQMRLHNLETQLERVNEDLVSFNDNENTCLAKIKEIGEQPQYDTIKISNLKTEIERLEPSVEKLNEAKNSASAITKYETEIAMITTEKSKNETKLAEVIKELSGKETLDEQFEKSKSVLLSSKGTLSNLNTTNSQTQSLIMMAEDALNNIDRIKKEISSLKEDKLKLEYDAEALKATKEAFSPNGIKAIIIDYVIPQLEDNINDILSQLSDFRVRLDTQKSGLTEGVTLDGLFVTVVDGNGQELEYNNYSGSEKMRISYAISEGLAKIQRCGFRIIDELVHGLDSDTESKFVEVIVQLTKNVKQIVCISHIQQVKDIFEESVLVTKTNGTSNIN